MFTQGTFTNSVWRGAMALISFTIPVLLGMHGGGWQDMTLGTILMIVFHFCETQLAK